MLLLFASAMFGIGRVAAAENLPARILYQGVLSQNGSPVNGTVPMVLRLTTADGATQYWTSGPVNVSVSNGSFRYAIGTPNESSFAAIRWASATPHVEITVNGAALSPREPLLHSPYALLADALTPGAVIQGPVLDMGGNRITSLGAPMNASDAATKAYVDAATNGPGVLSGLGRGAATDFNAVGGGTAGGVRWVDGGGSSNGPFPNSAGNLLAFDPLFNTGEAGKYRLQLSQPLDGNLYWRSQSNGAWSGWSRLLQQDSAGNVGVGTSAPTSRLEVRGGAIKATDGLILQVISASDTTTPRPTASGSLWLEQ